MPFPWDRIPTLDTMTRGDSRDVALTLDGSDTFAAGDLVRFAAEVKGIRIDKDSATGGVVYTPGTNVAVASIAPADTADVVVDSTFDVEWEVTTATGERYSLGRARLPVRVDKVLTAP